MTPTGLLVALYATVSCGVTAGISAAYLASTGSHAPQFTFRNKLVAGLAGLTWPVTVALLVLIGLFVVLVEAPATAGVWLAHRLEDPRGD